MEYTFTPGDVLEVQWDHPIFRGAGAGRMIALRINGSPVLRIRELWNRFLEEWRPNSRGE
jgi:hypothetical protein